MQSIRFTPQQEQIFGQALQRYGPNAQLEQTSEECLELALAIRKLKRAREARDFDPTDQMKQRHCELISEIADVIIMTKQCTIIYPVEMIQAEVDRKLQRQFERMNPLNDNPNSALKYKNSFL